MAVLRRVGGFCFLIHFFVSVATITIGELIRSKQSQVIYYVKASCSGHLHKETKKQNAHLNHENNHVQMDSMDGIWMCAIKKLYQYIILN